MKVRLGEARPRPRGQLEEEAGREQGAFFARQGEADRQKRRPREGGRLHTLAALGLGKSLLGDFWLLGDQGLGHSSGWSLEAPWAEIPRRRVSPSAI